MKEAARIKYNLTEKQLLKFCDIFGLDLAAVAAVNAISCLNAEYIRDILIRYDYEDLKKGLTYIETIHKSYSYDELKAALAKAYGMPVHEVAKIIRNRTNSDMHFCKKCGKRINKTMLFRTDGLCSDCMANTLDL